MTFLGPVDPTAARERLFDRCLRGGELMLPLSDKMLLAPLERCCPPGVYIWDGTSMSVKAGALDRGHKSFAVGPGAGKGG